MLPGTSVLLVLQDPSCTANSKSLSPFHLDTWSIMTSRYVLYRIATAVYWHDLSPRLCRHVKQFRLIRLLVRKPRFQRLAVSKKYQVIPTVPFELCRIQIEQRCPDVFSTNMWRRGPQHRHGKDMLTAAQSVSHPSWGPLLQRETVPGHG
jgi:hypothetical protein